MYAELTPDLIATIVSAFCDRRDILPTRRDFKKVFQTIVQDDDVEKFYFCEATCAGSGQPCMRQVPDAESYCHFHDPAFKCNGKKLDGNPCGSVARKDANYCWRHEEKDEEEITKKTNKNKHKKHLHSEDLSEEEDRVETDDEIITHRKSKKTKKHERHDKENRVHKKSKKSKRHGKNAEHKKSKKSKRFDGDADDKKAHKKSKKNKRSVDQEEMHSSLDDDTADEILSSETDDLPNPQTTYFPLRDGD